MVAMYHLDIVIQEVEIYPMVLAIHYLTIYQKDESNPGGKNISGDLRNPEDENISP